MAQTAMQTLIAWGDEMLLKHPQKLLSFGEAIDKAVELLQVEKEQIVDAFKFGVHEGFLTDINYMNCDNDAEQYYNETYEKS